MVVTHVVTGLEKDLAEDADNLFWRNAGNGQPRKANLLNDEGDGLKLLNPKGVVVASGEGRRWVAAVTAIADYAGCSGKTFTCSSPLWMLSVRLMRYGYSANTT